MATGPWNKGSAKESTWKITHSACDHVVITALSLAYGRRSRHKRPLSPRSQIRTLIRTHAESRTDGLFAGKTGLFRRGFSKNG